MDLLILGEISREMSACVFYLDIQLDYIFIFFVVIDLVNEIQIKAIYGIFKFIFLFSF